jgi:hypothetical protein
MADAGKYTLHGHMVVRDEVPPGVDPLLIRTTEYKPGDVVELTEEQATRLSAHRVNRTGYRGAAIEPYSEDDEQEDTDESAASVPSLSKKDD